MPSNRANKATRKVTQNKTMGRAAMKRTGNNLRKRNSKIVAAIVAAIALISLFTIHIANALLSQNLEITGAANVTGLNWSIHFANLGEVDITGKAKENTKPTIKDNSTKIGNYSIVLNRPGDAISYDFDVVNDGDINAVITSVTIKTGNELTCTSSASNASVICDNLSYTLTYNSGATVAVGDELSAGTTRKMTLKLALSNSLALNEMPNADVEVSGLEVIITYGQKAE